MSRRVVAPLLLLLAASLSVVAVFAVQRIEAGGGPLSEPSASTFFSPDGDGVQDVAEVRFATQRPERVTIDVVAADGTRVRRLLDDERVDGRRELTWDGRDDDGSVVPDGAYRIELRRAGDPRSYAPTRKTVVDMVDPIGRLDRATWQGGELRGLALLEPDARLELLAEGEADPLEGMLAFRPNPAARSARPEGPMVEGTVAVRFTVPLDIARMPIASLRFDAVDRAGNRTPLLPAPGAPAIAVVD